MKKSLVNFFKRIQAIELDLPPWNWPLAVGLVIIYGVVLILSVIFVTSISGDSLPDPSTLAWAHLLGLTLLFFLTFQYTNTALKRANRPEMIYTVLRIVPPQGSLMPNIFFIPLAIIIVLDTLGLAANITPDSMLIPLGGLSTDDTAPFLAAAIVVVILRPIVEELIFRGVFYTTLLKYMLPWPAILLSALVFALMRYALDPQLWWGFMVPFVLGMTAGMFRAATKSTQSAVIAHGMFGIFIVLRVILA